MSVLARYLMKSIVGHTLLVLAVLLSLSSLYQFIEQQDDIGIGTYSTTDAFMFVLFGLPQYAFDMLPIAALIGALLSLGNLARSMELIVIRTSGVSTARLAAWVFSAGLVLMASTWVIGEYIAPPLNQYGQQLKTFAKFHDYSVSANRGAWAKDGDTVISVQRQNAGNTYGGVYVFKFSPQRELLSIGRASSAKIDKDNTWLLSNYSETKILADRVVPSATPSLSLATRLSPEFLGLATVNPEALSASGLMTYVQHLKENSLDSRDYETAFWARIARTVAVAVIVVLAIPFAFGPMRSTNTGARTVLGIVMGVAFFLLAKMMESSGEVFNLQPLLVAWTPTVLLALITSIAVSRVR
jgi:lipopolysaccharide export system permease protein